MNVRENIRNVKEDRHTQFTDTSNCMILKSKTNIRSPINDLQF